MVRQVFGLACALAVFVPPAHADDPKPVLEVKGVVAPVARVVVSSKGTGVIRDIRVEAGQRVQKGEILAALDDEALKVELRVAQANVKRAEARFESVKSAGDFERRKCEASVQRAKAEWDRARKLGPAVSTAELGVLEQALTVTELDLKAATDGGKEAVARAEVEVARATLERVTLALAESRLLAPINGVVLHQGATAGQFVRPGDTLFEIADVSKWVARVRVPERALDQVAVGQACRVTLPGRDDPLAGKVLSIAPVIDPATSTGTVTVAIDTGDKPPRVGSSATIAFLPPKD